MKKHNIFNNFLATDTIILPDNKNLAEYCLTKINADSRYIEKNTKQSFFLDVNDVELSNLVSFIHNKLEGLREYLGIRSDLSQRIIEMWINVDGNKNINVTHCHPNRFLSGVFYVAAEENHSEIKFVTPIANHCYVLTSSLIEQYNEFNSSEWTVNPKTGTLLIFPSWLQHYVNIKNNEKQRISLAFNTMLDGF